MSKIKSPRCPDHLKPKSKKFWANIVSEFELEAHHLALLSQACVCLDRIEAAREILDAQGVTITDRFGIPRQHPAVAVELQNKTVFARLVRELALDVDMPGNRPPRLGGQRN